MDHSTTSSANCKTCGSEIVETINDSNFNEGECGPCEYQRYRSQPELVKKLHELVQMAESVIGNWENGSKLAYAVNSLERVTGEAIEVLKNSNGNAA